MTRQAPETIGKHAAQVADTLREIASVCTTLKSASIVLQNVMGPIVEGTPPNRAAICDLQMLDLQTQIHHDISEFLSALADSFEDGTTPSLPARDLTRFKALQDGLENYARDCAETRGDGGVTLF